ncbi:MAG: serine hydrolase [Chthonomonadales bacterium]
MNYPDSDVASTLLKQAAPDLNGRISFAAENVGTGQRLAFGAENKHATASVIKLPILVHALMEVEEGRLSLDTTVTLVEAEKTPGSGILSHLTEGLTIPVRDVLMLMTIVSDNTATNMMIDLLRIEPINACIRSLGLSVTTLFGKVCTTDRNIAEENVKYGLGVTTPGEMVDLLKRIASADLGLTTMQPLLREILSKQFYQDCIPRMLPPDHIFEGKSGSVDEVRNDVGIVTTPSEDQIAIAVFADDLTPNWTTDNPGKIAIGKLSRLLVEKLGEKC